jgi:hypothetical protein
MRENSGGSVSIEAGRAIPIERGDQMAILAGEVMERNVVSMEPALLSVELDRIGDLLPRSILLSRWRLFE